MLEIGKYSDFLEFYIQAGGVRFNVQIGILYFNNYFRKF